MESLLHIGNRVDAKSADYLKSLIKCVFEDGFKNHMSDIAITQALDVVKDAFKVENITVQHSTFTNLPTKPAAKKEN